LPDQGSHVGMSGVRSGRRRAILTAAGAAVAVALLGGLASPIGPWYYALRKPWFQPPDWLFGPAWTVIFALTAIAGVWAWDARPPMRRWAVILALFTANGLLNILWSLLFFTLHRPDWALGEMPALWLSVLGLIIAIWPASRRASLLLVPYLVWVAFAAILNLAVDQLNAPFG
jgi:tryptophan-rich sensory protein